VEHGSDDTSRAASVAVFPARGVPVAPQVGILEGYDDQVGEAGHDVLVATWAQVVLGRLVGMDPPDLDSLVRRYLGISAHNTRASVTAKAAATST